MLFLHSQFANHMGNNVDFLGQMDENIAAQGIVVLDEITHMPAYSEPYVSPYYIICINHSGNVHNEYDGLSVIFNPHDIAIVYPNHELFCHSTSPDYRATLIVVSEELFGQMVEINASRGRFWHESYPHFHLTDKQFGDIMSIVKALHTVLNINGCIRENAIEILQVLTNVIDNFRSENENTIALQTSNLSPRYYEAVKKYCHQHHDVTFYANLFCLTPKYFSTLIRQETGRTASHWIQQHLVAQAKIILRTKKDMRLGEVSELLGFPDITAFSRFFRRETGMSPSEYRKS